MSPDSKILETDLYKPIQNYFEKLGYLVHGEVKSCDMTASKGDELIIVELKRTLNIELLLQAANRQKITDNVYIAIPKPKLNVFTKKWKDLCHLIRRLELGLITVNLKNKKPTVDVILTPSPFSREKSRQRHKNKKTMIANEINGRHGNFNTGGSTRVKIMTAYRENSIQIACLLKKAGPASALNLKKAGAPEKTLAILTKNYYGWFEKISRGTYKLNDPGEKALLLYPELVSYYEKMVMG